MRQSIKQDLVCNIAEIYTVITLIYVFRAALYIDMIHVCGFKHIVVEQMLAHTQNKKIKGSTKVKPQCFAILIHRAIVADEKDKF